LTQSPAQAWLDDEMVGITSDSGDPYVDGEDCALVEVSKAGGFFMRTTYPFDCDDVNHGRAMTLDFSVLKPPGTIEAEDCEVEAGGGRKLDICGENLVRDVMFSARGMFVRPSRKNPVPHATVRLTFELEPNLEGEWFQLLFVSDIPVTINDDGSRTLVAEVTQDHDYTEAELWLIDPDLRKKKQLKELLGVFSMPFRLTVMPH
jgi:hypothetical protein